MGPRVSVRDKKLNKARVARASDKDESMTLLDLIRTVKKPRQRSKNPAPPFAEEEHKENATAELFSSSDDDDDDDDLGKVSQKIKRKRKCKDLYDILKREPVVNCATFDYQDNDRLQLRKAKKSVQPSNKKDHDVKGDRRSTIVPEFSPSIVSQSKDIHHIAGSPVGQADDLTETLETLISFSDSLAVCKPGVGTEDPALDCFYSQVTVGGKRQKSWAAAALSRPRSPHLQAAGNGRSSQSRLFAGSHSAADLLPVSGAGLHKCADSKNCKIACVAKAVAPNLDHMSEDELIYWYEEVTGTKFTSRQGERVRGRIRRVIRAELKTASALNGSNMSSAPEVSGRCESSSLETSSPSPAQLIIDLTSPVIAVSEFSGPIFSKEDISCAFNSAGTFDEFIDEEIAKASINFIQTRSGTLTTEEMDFAPKCEPLEITLAEDEPLSVESVEVKSVSADCDLDASNGWATICEPETQCGGAPFSSEKRAFTEEKSTDIVHCSQIESHERQSHFPSAESSLSDTDSLGIVAYDSLEEMRVSQMDFIDDQQAQVGSPESTPNYNCDLSTTGESNPCIDLLASGRYDSSLDPRTPSPALELSPERKVSFGEGQDASPERGPEASPVKGDYCPTAVSKAFMAALEVFSEKKASFGEGKDTSPEREPQGSAIEDDYVPTIASRATTERKQEREMDSSHSLAEQKSHFEGQERNAIVILDGMLAVEDSTQEKAYFGRIEDASPERASEGSPMEDYDIQIALSKAVIERKGKGTGAVDRPYSLTDREGPFNGQEWFAEAQLDMMFGVEGAPQVKPSIGRIDDTSPQRVFEDSPMEVDFVLTALSKAVIERCGAEYSPHSLPDQENPRKGEELKSRDKPYGVIERENQKPSLEQTPGSTINYKPSTSSRCLAQLFDPLLDGQPALSDSPEPTLKFNCDLSTTGESTPTIDLLVCEKLGEEGRPRDLEPPSILTPQKKASCGEGQEMSPQRVSEGSPMEDDHIPTALSKAIIERKPALSDSPEPTLKFNCDLSTTGESTPTIDLLVCEKLGEEGSPRDLEPPSILTPQKKASCGEDQEMSPQRVSEGSPMEDDHIPTALSKAIIERNGERRATVDSSHSSADQESPQKVVELNPEEKPGSVFRREKRKASIEQSLQSMNSFKPNGSSRCLAQSYDPLLDSQPAQSDSPEPTLISNCDLSTNEESTPSIDLLACEKLREEGSSEDLEPPSKLPCRRKTISPLSQLELMRESSSDSPPSDESSPPQKVPAFLLKLPGGLASQHGELSLLDREPINGCSCLEPNTKSGRNEASDCYVVSLDSSEDDTEDICGREQHGSRDEPVRKLSLALSPTSPSPESGRIDSSQNTSSQEPREFQSISAPSKGILKTGPQSCKGLCKCAACSTSRAKAGTASAFIASQMKTFQRIAGLLTEEMQGLRTVIATNFSGPEKTSEIQEILKKSRDVEEAADKNVARLLRDCKCYRKLTATKPIPVRKIIFADEAGKTLCHVKTFQSQSSQVTFKSSIS